MKRHNAGLVVLLASLALAASCSRRPEDEQVLATVGRQPITLGDFRRAMEQRGGDVPGVFASDSAKQELLEEMIAFEVLVADAHREGLFRDPDIRRALRQMAVDKLISGLREDAGRELQVEDAEVKDFYDRHAEDYRVPEKARMALIKVAVPRIVSAEKKAELAARAAEARAEALALDAKVKNLGYVAAKYSDDQATRYRGGDAGWLAAGARSRWGSNVVAAAFSLAQPGEISPVVESEDGLYVLKLMERQGETAVPLDQVRETIRRRLAKEKSEAFQQRIVAERREHVRVVVNQRLLKSVSPPPGPGPDAPVHPPSLPVE